MSTKLYVCILGAVSAAFVLGVLLLAGFRLSALGRPERPARMPAEAVWRPTPTESVRLLPHGDWVVCRQQGAQDYCAVTDESGATEYDGAFSPLPEGTVVPANRLIPTTSETLSPWMWSNHANRLVPLIQLEDGTVLVPTPCAADLKGYVERIQKFSAQLKSPPSYLEYHPAGTPPSHDDQ